MATLRDTYVDETKLDHSGRSAWGAIFAGAAVGLAVFAVLSLLGIGLGLTAIEIGESDALGAVPVASPIWIFVSQIVSLGVAGFVAGRLAGVLHKVGTMLHGATVWAVSTIIGGLMAVIAGAGLFSMAGSSLNFLGSTASQLAPGAGQAISAAIPDDINLPDLAVSQVGLEDLPDPVASRLRAEGITPENFREEAREAFRNVISRSEQASARRAVSSTAMAILSSPRDIREELRDLADTLIGGENAVLSEEDRAEAIRVMERRLGLTPQEVAAYVDQVEARLEEARVEVQAAVDTAQRELEQAQATAIELADTAADRAAAAALLAALAALVGLGAAVGGAYLGRPVKMG